MIWVITATETGALPRAVRVEFSTNQGPVTARLYILPSRQARPGAVPLRRSALRAPEEPAPPGGVALATLTASTKDPADCDLLELKVQFYGEANGQGHGPSLDVTTSRVAGRPDALRLEIGTKDRISVLLQAGIEQDLALRPGGAWEASRAPAGLARRIVVAVARSVGLSRGARGGLAGSPLGRFALALNAVALVGSLGFGWHQRDRAARAEQHALQTDEALLGEQGRQQRLAEAHANAQLRLAAQLDDLAATHRARLAGMLGLEATDPLIDAALRRPPSRALTATERRCTVSASSSPGWASWVLSWYPLSGERCDRDLELVVDGVTRIGPWAMSQRGREQVGLPPERAAPTLEEERQGLLAGVQAMARVMPAWRPRDHAITIAWALFWWDMANQLPNQPNAPPLSVCVQRAVPRLQGAASRGEAGLPSIGAVADATVTLPLTPEAGCLWSVTAQAGAAGRVLDAIDAALDATETQEVSAPRER